jgi:transposase-like protein
MAKAPSQGKLRIVVISICQHEHSQKYGKTAKGEQRHRCTLCGHVWFDAQLKPLGDMRVDIATAKLALRMLTEGMSIRATERTTGLHRDTICKLIVLFGNACQRFLDERMRGLKLEHLQFDEQWTYVAKKQSRLTIDQRAESHEQGDVYLWTCVDQKTKLMPAFMVGKRSADNARRFMMDVARRLVMPNPHASDAHAYAAGGYQPITQISTDGFPAYPEAVDLAFGPYVKFGTIIKDYRNASMSPSSPSIQHHHSSFNSWER